MDGNSSDFLGDFMFHGVINIYKEPGFTSHDVVAKLRGILRQKKIGHTGTLDPAAEGVLPVCLGKGTKLCDLLTDKRKTYQAVLLLGTETDTQDTTGTILSEKPTEQLTEPAVRGAAESLERVGNCKYDRHQKEENDHHQKQMPADLSVFSFHSKPPFLQTGIPAPKE